MPNDSSVFAVQADCPATLFVLIATMSNSIVSQIPKNLLFRYRLNCQEFDGKPGGDFELGEEYRLPHLGQFEAQIEFADVRIAWHAKGLLVSVAVTEKKQSLWCRPSELLDSDGLQLWIDTRDTHNVHRATKFCHWFVILPASGPRDEKPLVSMLKINRSRADSPTINRSKVKSWSKITKKGYELRAFIPSETLHGWDANEHPNIGFNYGVLDRELGWQTLAIGPQLPIQEDPSLWQSLNLKSGQ